MESPAYIYVVMDGNFCKIGVATNPVKRLADLQIGNPRPLTMPHKFECWHIHQARELEMEAHMRLVEHGYAKSGEWFRITPDEAAWVIRGIDYMLDDIGSKKWRVTKAVRYRGTMGTSRDALQTQ